MAAIYLLITAFSASLSAFNVMTGDYATALVQAIVAGVSAWFFEKELLTKTKEETE